MHSGITQFVVGKDRQKISIHTALTSLFSKVILQPPMIEEMDDVLFGRCFEFVYSGDYSVPSPIYEPHNCQRGITSSTEPVRRWDPAGLTWNYFHPEKFSIICADLRERLGQVNPNYRANDEKSTDPNYSYADIFLCHAEMYRVSSRTGWTTHGLGCTRWLSTLGSFEA